MARLSGQSGVPVTVGGGDVIVGFDQQRLQQLASRVGGDGGRPRLGMQVRDAVGGGAEVGRVTAGSPADRAGVQTGDVVAEMNGRSVASAADVERYAAQLSARTTLMLGVRRAGGRLNLRAEL